MAIEVVPTAVLQAEWIINRVDSKIDSGLLTLHILHATAARNPAWLGGESRILKVLTPNGQHIGTFHEVVLPNGTVPHRHPKDYTMRDCSRIREPVER